MFIEFNLESSLLVRCISSYMFKKTDTWKIISLGN